MVSTKQIVFTRLISDQSKARLNDLALNWSEHPFIEVQYNSNIEHIEKINNLRCPLVFTSKHSVLSLYENELKTEKKIINRSCYAISPITKQIAINYGYKIIGTATTSRALAKVIFEADESIVIHLTTENRREELYTFLGAKNIKIVPIITYRKNKQKTELGPFDIIAFFSPSQIDAFLETNKIQEHQTVFCIGQTTADYGGKRSFHNIIVPDISSEEQVIESIFQHTKSYE